MTDPRPEIHKVKRRQTSLSGDDNGRVFVLYKGNLASGGTATEIELADFLG